MIDVTHILCCALALSILSHSATRKPAMETAYCKSCDQNKPIDRFGKSGLGLKPQCKDCRKYTEKVNRDHEKAVKLALQRGEKPPPKPELPQKDCRPVGHLNDTNCPTCGMLLKRQRMFEHTRNMHPEQPHACKYCPFTCDCYGFLVHHCVVAHPDEASAEETTYPRPIALSTCVLHMDMIARHKRSVIVRNKEREREQKRERNANLPVEAKMQRRNTGQRNDAKRAGKRKCDTSKYEGTPLRKHQKQFQEKSLVTRNMRLRWRVRNFSKVRGSWRRYHDAHRAQRNAYSRQYRVKNKRLRLQQIQYSAQLRGFKFTLTTEAAYALMDAPCFYCDSPPEETTKTGLHGFDRVNNHVGYTPTNTVPCCPTCNYMKGALAVKDFLSQVEKIGRYLRLDTAEDVDSPARLVGEEEFEDSVLQWGGPVNQGILNNVEAIHTLVQHSQVDPLVMFNHISRRKYRERLQWLRASLDDVRDSVDDRDGFYTAVASADNAAEVIEDMCNDVDGVLTEFARVSKKKYMVEWAGKAEWKLTDEEAVALIYKNECTYCGQVGNLGFDRVDPKGVYHIDNVVPACATCNIMRSDSPVPLFVEGVKRIVDTLGLQVGNLDVVIDIRKRRFTGAAELVVHDPQRKMKVSSVALMLQDQPKNNLRIHSRMCGKGAEPNWRVVDVAKVMEKYPNATFCKVCVAQEDGCVAQDCKDHLPEGTLEIENYAHLVRGLVLMRCDECVITDCQRVYHSQIHKHSNFPHFVVKRDLVDQHLQYLKPCKTCVSFSANDPLFDGCVGLPTVSTMAELVRAKIAANEHRLQDQRERRLRSIAGTQNK